MSQILDAPTTLFSTATGARPASIVITDSHQLRRLVGRINSALRDSGGGGIMERLDHVVKILIAKLHDEREKIDGQKSTYEFALFPTDHDPAQVHRRIQHIYERAIQSPMFAGSFTTHHRSFPADALGIVRIVAILHPFLLSRCFHDINGSAFQELLRDTFDKNENQQFFTPSEVAAFMTNVAAVAIDKPLEDARVCDPAVGTGGLLLGVVRRALEALERASHRNQGRIQDYAGEYVFGADCDERMAWIAMVNVALTTNAAANIFHLNSGGGSLDRLRHAEQLPEGSFDLIITNPPFGSDLIDPAVLNQYTLGRGRPSRRRSILFVERCLNLLRPGGVVVMVIDDSVLSQPSTADVRALIQREAAVRAVFSLPDTAFMPYASVKASVLVLEKRHPLLVSRPVLMVDVEETGRKPNGEPLYADERGPDGARILLSDLPDALDAFTAYHRGQAPTSLGETTAFLVDDHELRQAEAEDHSPQSIGEAGHARLDVLRYHPIQRQASNALSKSPYPIVELRALVSVRSERVNPSESPDEIFRYIGLADIEKFTGQWQVQELRGDTIKSSCNAFRGGEIIFARLRPNLRKVVLVHDDDEGGVCSSECAVFRVKDHTNHDQTLQLSLMDDSAEYKVSRAYLAWMLRSDLVYGQIMGKVTGVGRPRVSTTSVLSVKIPLPPLAEQQRLAEAMQQAWDDLDRMRQKVKLQVADAERQFQVALHQLGGLHPE